MSKIVFVNVPLSGHTNPTLGVARALCEKGHTVYYFSYEILRKKIEETGARFLPCDAMDPEMLLSKKDGTILGEDLAYYTELEAELTSLLLPRITEEIRKIGPEVIVGDFLAFWAKAAAQKLSVPYVCSETTLAFNKYSSRILPREDPAYYRKVFDDPRVIRSAAKFQEMGCPVTTYLDVVQNRGDVRTIVYTSPYFQPEAETFGGNYLFCGPVIGKKREETEHVPVPTVYVSLGTVDNENPGFYRNCLEAARGEKIRMILSVGSATDIASLGKIPANCVVKPFVDQVSVLEKTDVFLTHCGMNSASEALYFGVPLLMMPGGPEQSAVAARVSELDAGILLPDSSPESIRKSIREVLSAKELREGAKKISDSFRALKGADAAAEFILTTMNRR